MKSPSSSTFSNLILPLIVDILSFSLEILRTYSPTRSSSTVVNNIPMMDEYCRGERERERARLSNLERRNNDMVHGQIF